MNRPITQLERRCWRRSWRWSTVVHLLVAGLILVEALWLPFPFAAGQGDRAMMVVQQQPLDDQPLEMEMQIEERPWIARDAEDPTYSQVDLNDPRWADILTEPERHTAGLAGSQADEGAGNLISIELLRSIEASSRRSDDENLRNLERLSGRLTQVSSTETVEELSGTIGRLVGTEARETKPKEAVEGLFDIASGQPHDCKKIEKANGQVRYLMVMIDKAGRTQEVELDEADGEQLYRTMQLIKSNPLLERIYRGVVMGILDKLLAPGDTNPAKPR